VQVRAVEASARARSMQHNDRQGAMTVMASGPISSSSKRRTQRRLKACIIS
jgi:hypothetical protein